MLVLLSLCVILSSQVDANLLDPTLIGRELQKFAKDALGVDEMQNYFDGLQYHKRTIKGEDITPQLAIKLSDKFKTRFEVVKRLKKAVEESYARSAKATPLTECCKVDKSTLKYDERFRCNVDLDNVCLKISGSASPNPVHLDEGVFNEMKDILKTYPFIKWQYFGSEKGVMASYPVFDDKEKCDKFDNRYRPWYVETATPEAKDVVLVIDISASMTGEKLYIAKEAAKTVLDTLNPKDQVGIVSFNTNALTPEGVGGKGRCYSERLALAIPTNIGSMKNYVDGLVPFGLTQYRLAFEKAFSLLKGSIAEESGINKKRLILFLTDGAPTDPEMPIFETIKNRNFELNNSVVILTFGFGSADQAILQDIAKQDTAKHGVAANTSVGDITPGRYTFVEDIKTLRIKMATYYNLFALGRRLSPVVSVPYIDAFGTGLLITITLPCFHQGNFIGVTGTDIVVENLLADITFFNQDQSTYAFMISNSGRTLIHPLLPAPTDAYGDPIFMDIRSLEPETEFNEVFDSITNGKSGYKTFVAKRFLPRGGKEKEGVTVTEMNSTYFWTPLVRDIDFSLGVVVPASHAKDQLNSLQIPDGYKFKYHRIDLNHPEKPCSQFGAYASKDITVVKFAPGAFKDPYKYIGKQETKADVDLLTAYMKDDTGTVTNPGLKNDIRDTVIATWKVEDLWLRDKTDLAQYVVWRYIGTSNGVFRTTPGSSEEKLYDPRQRPWYYTALANTGMLTLTTPYLDFGGAGVVITAGRALYRGEPDHIHHTNDEVIGVMGADFPLTYFYRLLTNVYPKCKETKTYSCFVMDSAGFLIMHKDFLLSSAAASDVEYVHITEKDKHIAEDLIKKRYLRKKECRDLEELQKQSYYEVHLPRGGVDALRSGATCSKYQLGQIIGTNAYIGVAVKESFCSLEPCPCSSDNKCSFFNLTCECPCHSPLDFHYCRSQFPVSSLPICPPSAPEIPSTGDPSPPLPKKKCEVPMSGLEKCFDPRCSEKNSSQTCEGIVGCYWCKNDMDDLPLKEPYCAGSEVCFRGREAEQEKCPTDEGSKTMLNPIYVNSSNSPFNSDDQGSLSTGAIVGIVIGCMVAVALVVSLLVMRHFRNYSGSPIHKDTSPSTEQIIDLENQDHTNRPPAPLPEPAEDTPELNYEDPDELQRSHEAIVTSFQWPSPYNQVRFGAPSVPPPRKQCTVTAPVLPRQTNVPVYNHLSFHPEGRRHSSGNPQPLVPPNRMVSAASVRPLLNTVIRIQSADIQQTDRASFVTPTPPIYEERKPSEDTPRTFTSDTDRLPDEAPSSSSAATEIGERPYKNMPPPLHKSRSSSDTSLMSSIAETKEPSDSNRPRPALQERASLDSNSLDPRGYLKLVPLNAATVENI